MNHICGECGYSKTCSEEEFMIHMHLHDELDALLEQMGITQEEKQFKVTITTPDGETFESYSDD